MTKIEREPRNRKAKAKEETEVAKKPSRADEIRAIVNSDRYHEIFDIASPNRPYSKVLESARNPSVWHQDALTRTRGLLGELIPDYTDYDQKALGDLFFHAWAVNREIKKARPSDVGILLSNYQGEKEWILEDLKPTDRDVVLAIHETIVEKGIYKDISKRTS